LSCNAPSIALPPEIEIKKHNCAVFYKWHFIPGETKANSCVPYFESPIFSVPN
jgi:hypothetical protein